LHDLIGASENDESPCCSIIIRDGERMQPNNQGLIEGLILRAKLRENRFASIVETGKAEMRNGTIRAPNLIKIGRKELLS
jgi:hypothetical protein